VYAGDVYAVHNGHVSNDAELIRESWERAARQGGLGSDPGDCQSLRLDLAGEAMEQVEGAAAVALMHAATAI